MRFQIVDRNVDVFAGYSAEEILTIVEYGSGGSPGLQIAEGIYVSVLPDGGPEYVRAISSYTYRTLPQPDRWTDIGWSQAVYGDRSLRWKVRLGFSMASPHFDCWWNRSVRIEDDEEWFGTRSVTRRTKVGLDFIEIEARVETADMASEFRSFAKLASERHFSKPAE